MILKILNNIHTNLEQRTEKATIIILTNKKYILIWEIAVFDFKNVKIPFDLVGGVNNNINHDARATTSIL